MLGRLEVANPSGQAVPIGAKAFSLLAFLSLQKHREFSNHELQQTFWPESEGDKQAQNLRRAIADLRKVLELGLPLGSVIRTRKGLVSLNPATVETDADRFLELSRDGADERDLTDAVGLYAGPLLSAVDDPWATSHRLGFEERYGQVVHRLCGMLVDQGRAKEAVTIGRAAVVAAPSREDIHIALIGAYGAAGLAVEALKQFEELERVLDETWGEEPSQAARAALESASEFAQATKHNLPAQSTSFIGREAEIAEALVLFNKTRLLTFTGSGGCGKTRLSLEVAAKAKDQFRDGVWFVEFAATTDPALIHRPIAAALGATEQPGTPLLDTLLNSLKSKKTLIVLDNCEHLLQACAQLATDLLRACPSVKLLASSREGLRIPGETTYRVPSLSLPDPNLPQTPETLSQCESVRLFVERAACVLTTFAVTEENAPATASVCRRLDGIPLAIELAAARLGSMSVWELEKRLDERFALLTGGSRTAMPRQQTLRSLIDWSYDLLNEAEKALFRRLAVFAGSWTVTAAEEACSDEEVRKEAVLDLVTSLCDKSLVVAESENDVTRYRMLETVRYFSRDRLLECGESPIWRDRHLAFFLALAQEAEPHLCGPNQVEWLDRLEADHDNLRAALDWSISVGGRHGSALILAGAMLQFWERRGFMSEGRSRLRTVLETAAAEASVPRAKVMSGAARLAGIQTDQQTARRLAEESAEIQRQLGDFYGLANSMQTLGAVALELGDLAAARQTLEECRTISEQIGDWHGVARTVGNLGIVQFYDDDMSGAQTLYEQCLTIRRNLGDKLGIAVCVNALSDLALRQGRIDASLELAQEGLLLNREIRNRRGLGVALGHIAAVHTHRGEFELARSCFLESLAVFRDLGLGYGTAYTIAGLAHIDSLEGEYPSAVARFQEALSMYWEQKRLFGIFQVLRDLGWVFGALFRNELAARHWGAEQNLRERANLPVPEVELERYEQGIARSRAAMADDDAFDRAWQAGKALNLEDAVEMALTADLSKIDPSPN